jgi:hypothetical protein
MSTNNYSIYISVLTSFVIVLDCEREHNRFKQTREKATKESKESSENRKKKVKTGSEKT